ncbi:MAG TPA: hypothetical protein VMW29_01690 [Candidatus Bathyarchaeia archaeon]|nr:hypothetical protein [Candidatus Bathyarchaeia archaeon]
MKKLFKIIFSIPIFFFFLLALADILSGDEPLIDETIIVILTLVWVVYLIKPFKPPKFFLAFLIFLLSTVFHNVISHLMRFEEPFFFLLALLSFAASVILFFTYLIRKFFRSVKR